MTQRSSGARKRFLTRPGTDSPSHPLRWVNFSLLVVAALNTAALVMFIVVAIDGFAEEGEFQLVDDVIVAGLSGLAFIVGLVAIARGVTFRNAGIGLLAIVAAVGVALLFAVVWLIIATGITYDSFEEGARALAMAPREGG